MLKLPNLSTGVVAGLEPNYRLSDSISCSVFIISCSSCTLLKWMTLTEKHDSIENWEKVIAPH